jgi:hypothetical protein
MQSTPFPQLFPNLNKRLHLAGAGNPAVNESAVPVALLVIVPHGGQAKMSQIMPEFREVLLAQHLRFSLVGTPSHTGRILHFSSFVRPASISEESLLRKAGFELHVAPKSPVTRFWKGVGLASAVI